MKFKNILLPIIALSTFATVSFGVAKFTTRNLIAAYAEGEVAENTQAENTDESTLQKIESKAKEILNYQVLGVTIGTIVGGLISVGFTYLLKKAEKIEYRKLYEISRNANEHYEDFMEKAEKITSDYGILHEEYVAFKEKSDALLTELKEENANLKSVAEEEKKARLEERKFFLALISNTSETVASGLAEKLNAYFENKD